MFTFLVYCCCSIAKLHLTLLWSHGLQPVRLLCPWDFPGKNTGGGSISFSRGSSQSRDQTHVSCFGRWILYQWVTWEALSWFTHFLWWKLLQQLPEKGCMEGEFFENLYVWIIFQFTLPLEIIVCIGIEFQGFPDSSTSKESSWNAGDPGLIPGSRRSPGKGIGYPLHYSWASLVAQVVQNSAAVGKLGCDL